MKVICINNSYYPVSLSLNKIYNVERETKVGYIIIDENHESWEYPKEIFEIKDDL
jgi:hypothetical protein